MARATDKRAPDRPTDPGAVVQADGSTVEHVSNSKVSGADGGTVDGAKNKSATDATRTEIAQQREDFKERLENLPPGHPASPYNGDGSRKPPVPNPADSELSIPGDPDFIESESSPELQESLPPVEPLTDTEYKSHVERVRECLRQAHAAGLSTDEMYTLDARHEVWAEERETLHDALIEDLYQQASDVPSEHRAIIAGGLPGAGKTTVLDEKARIDRSQFLTINPDDIKDELARRGMIPQLEGLSPMEASDLVHEESSHLAKRLAARAQGDGKNLIWDITMSSLDSVHKRINDLRDNGYTYIEGIFIDLAPEISSERATSRHRADHERYRNGEGQGGRLIPTDVILGHADPEWGSLNRRTFEAAKSALDGWLVYDNSVDGRAPVLLDFSSVRSGTSEW